MKPKLNVFFYCLILLTLLAEGCKYLENSLKEPVPKSGLVIEQNLVAEVLMHLQLDYIDSEKLVSPLKVKFSGVYANVNTQSIFGNEDFKFKKAVILPGLTGENGPLPIFIIKAKSALLKTKVSVDQ